jgi:hypothetical protein
MQGRENFKSQSQTEDPRDEFHQSAILRTNSWTNEKTVLLPPISRLDLSFFLFCRLGTA